MPTARTVLTVCAAALLTAGTASADCCLPSWCVFGGAKKTSQATVVPVANHQAGAPSVLTKMGYGTRRLMTNTKDLLTFQKPSKRGANTYQTASGQKEPGFFYKLFHPEPAQQPRTVEEWMSLEQITP